MSLISKARGKSESPAAVGRDVVYVDQLFVMVSRDRHAKVVGEHQWCHMWSEDVDSLHRMAKKIGLKEQWFQDRENFPHYDLVQAKRDKAIEAGAVEIDLRDWIRREKAKGEKSVLPTLMDRPIGHKKVYVADTKRCELCSSLDAWLPRKQFATEKDWRCWHCSPPAKPQMVANRRGPIYATEQAEQREENAQSQREREGSIVVAMERSICGCGCRWMVEIPTAAGIESQCWLCQRRLP
ncbi:MAG TPA: DUF4031 domain-containing protein, partial [Tichowtungia sp.]|nr:DUF4031 domain-containing protein [Tichowtungia sp.]